MMSGTKMVHVPFSDGAPGLAALVGGQVQVMADNMNSALPMINSGKVRAIAVTTAQRSVALPDATTVAEKGCPASIPVPGSGCSRPQARRRRSSLP
jgi:tripartite-type tricarboxylate transporter receptor subunit TctC